MNWRKDRDKDQGRERGYHHGNLREALLQAALDLIAQKGAAGFTFADAARMAGVSPAAPYRHFRDRDELLSSIAQRGFEQFEAALTASLGRRTSRYRHRVRAASARPISNSRASEPAFYSAMFESGIPVDMNPALMAAGERAFAHHPRRRRTAGGAGAAGRAAPAGDDDGAAYLVDVAWRGVAVRARRRGAAQAADVAGGTAGSRGADLSARARLPDRPPAARRQQGPGEKRRSLRARRRAWGTPK